VSALGSLLNPKSAAFQASARRMKERLDEVRALEARVIAESESKRDKFEAKGQLLPRERVARLLDRGSGFLELSSLAGLGMHDDDGKKAVLGGGSIVGIGTVSGKRVLIFRGDGGRGQGENTHGNGRQSGEIGHDSSPLLTRWRHLGGVRVARPVRPRAPG